MTPPTIRRGSTGEHVRAWQEILNRDGAGLVVDGVFGAATEAATKAWQIAHGLAADAIVGPATWALAMGASKIRAEAAFVGARGVDSLPYSQAGTKAQAEALKASGIDFFVGYLGVINPTRLGYLLDAGLAFMPVTLANRYDGAEAVRQCRSLGLPAGCTVWLDVEGMVAYRTPPAELIATINTWADTVEDADLIPGIYVGAPQPLTGPELSALHVKRYWLGIGRCVDRNGKDAYPTPGWCMHQQWHGQATGMFWRDTGVFVDTNSIQCDHRNRLPTWAVRSE